MNKPTLYLIRGVCGAGKSSFAESLYWKHLVFAVLEADQYFVDSETGEYHFNPNLIAEAHRDCQNRAKMHLKMGNDIAVSNTSTTEREVQVYAKIAEECNAKFVSIVVENRHGSKSIHNVPEEKIQQMKNRFSIKL